MYHYSYGLHYRPKRHQAAMIRPPHHPHVCHMSPCFPMPQPPVFHFHPTLYDQQPPPYALPYMTHHGPITHQVFRQHSVTSYPGHPNNYGHELPSQYTAVHFETWDPQLVQHHVIQRVDSQFRVCNALGFTEVFDAFGNLCHFDPKTGRATLGNGVKLPTNWSIKIDAQNQVVYFDHATQKGTFIRPRFHLLDPPSAFGPLPKDWQRRIDPNSMQIYFVNYFMPHNLWAIREAIELHNMPEDLPSGLEATNLRSFLRSRWDSSYSGRSDTPVPEYEVNAGDIIRMGFQLL